MYCIAFVVQLAFLMYQELTNIELLREHLEHLLPLAAEVYQRATAVLQANPASLGKLYGKIQLSSCWIPCWITLFAGILFHSAAGALLSKTLHALLLLPVAQIQPLLFHLLGVLGPMDRLNRMLPAAALPDLEAPDTASGNDVIDKSCCNLLINFIDPNILKYWNNHWINILKWF